MKTSSGKKHSILNLFSEELEFITFWHRKMLYFHRKKVSVCQIRQIYKSMTSTLSGEKETLRS